MFITQIQNIQGVSKKTEFSGKQPWQIQLLWVGNTVGFFYKSRLCCFLTTSFPGRCVNNIYVHSRIHNNKSTANFCDQKQIITGLLFKVATPCCDALSCPCSHVKCGPPHHCWVKLSQLPGDIGLQLVEGGRERDVHLGLQVAPEVGRSRRLLPTFDEIQRTETTKSKPESHDVTSFTNFIVEL